MADKTPVEKDKLDRRDWPHVVEFVVREYEDRKRRRVDLNERWAEVDRQIEQKPDAMVTEQGNRPEDEGWFKGLALPLQSQTLEVLTSDIDRIRFPEGRNFFSAHSEMTDDNLRSLEDGQFFPDVKVDVPARVDQGDLDAIVEAALTHNHSLYGFREQWNRLDAEAIRYGTMVARLAMIRPDKTRDGMDRKPIPMIVPSSVRNTYLDDSVQHVMNEGVARAPATIREYWQNLADLRIAARGSENPDKFTGGWMPRALDELEPDQDGNVKLLEYEGDPVLPRSRGPNIYLENVIVTVVIGKGKEPARPVRLRYNQFPFRPTFSQPYHVESAFSPYGVGPLMLGAPLQRAATYAKNALMQASILNGDPVIWINPADYYAHGASYSIHPGAKLSSVTAPQELQIGDPVALMQVVGMLLQFYADVVGVNPPRLGAQTKSHQTAFAVDSEITLGRTRTVDYVRASNQGAMTQFLKMEYAMLRATMPRGPVYSEKMGGWFPLDRAQLPERVTFDVHGAGGPMEEREREVRQQTSLTLALQIEQFRRQAGEQGLNLDKFQEFILQQGFNNVDYQQFLTAPGQAGPAKTPVADPAQAAVAQLLGGA